MLSLRALRSLTRTLPRTAPLVSMRRRSVALPAPSSHAAVVTRPVLLCFHAAAQGGGASTGNAELQICQR